MPLTAGAARAVVTPPVGYRMGQWALRRGRSTGVHRDLYARSLVISDGATTLAIVSVDVCGFPEAVSARIHSRIEEMTGIPPENVLLSSTHNHTAPDFLKSVPDELLDYSRVFADSVTGSVYEAASAARPATVGQGAGDLPGWTVNRQYRDRPVDTEVGVLVVDGTDGMPIARAVNFACHGVCDGGQYLEWSADFSGEMSAFMEEADPPAVSLFIQGAGGDVHPFDWWLGNLDSAHMHTHEDTRLLGEALGTEAMRAAQGCGMSPEATLEVACEDVSLPRHRVRWTVQEAESLRDDLVTRLPPYLGDVWPEGTTTANAAVRHPEVYGRGANEISLAREQDYPPLEVRVQALRIGDLVVSAVPGELFNDLGRQIKDGREGPAWCAAYCRGYIGYVSSRGPYDDIEEVPLHEIVDMARYRRFYGTTTSPFSPEAGEILVSRAVELMREVVD